MRVNLTCQTPYSVVKSLVAPDSELQQKIAAGTLFGEVETTFATDVGLEEQIKRFKTIDISKIAFRIDSVDSFTDGIRHGFDIHITPHGLFADVTRHAINVENLCTLKPRAIVRLTDSKTTVPYEEIVEIITFDLTHNYNQSPQAHARGIASNTLKE